MPNVSRASSLPLRKRLRHSQPFVLEGFPYSPPPWGGLCARSFTETPTARLIEAFAARLIASVGKSYLPVYRMADGEFAFLVGPRGNSTQRLPPFLQAGVNFGARYWRSMRGVHLRTIWRENYPRTVVTDARKRLEHSLRRIADAGYLAPYFVIRPDGWGDAFFHPVCNWLDHHGVPLHEGNYVPFYGIYAVLAGPRRRELLEGRRVLVATHLTPERENAIKKGLQTEGVLSVEFLPVSATASLLDDVAVSRVRTSIDLAIVAAGIGSANIIDQLQPLKTPCIDAGIALECWINEERRYERPFLIATDRASRDEIALRRKF